MAYSRRAKAVDLRDYLAKALSQPIELAEIDALSLSSRCALIKRMIEAGNQSGKPDVTGMSEVSLLRLSKAFEISEGFHEWQRRKRQTFIKALTLKPNRPILAGFRNWERLSIDSKKFVLRKSVRLHRKIYVEGVTERLPYNHDFQEGAIKRNGRKLTLVFGNFSGDLRTGHSRITQYTLHGEMVKSASEAFDTAHHEGTHLIQHHLSVAFHRKQIPPSHPLHTEAAYFNAVDRHRAYVPSSRTDAYRAQPHEVFSHWEGEKIASAIEALAM